MKKGSIITAITVLLVPMMAMAQKQYFLPTGSADMSENDKPMIEVYLPRQDVANGCAVVLCPGGAMRWLSWEDANAELHMYGDGKGPYELIPQTGETTTETWSTQLIQWLKAKGFINK